MAQTNKTDWAEQAAATQAAVFPISIFKDEKRGRWQKRPLTAHGHLDASKDVSRFDWSRANGFGIRMGAGWYALDLDTYKDGCAAQEWFRRWEVPTNTRVHQTVSGGSHLIYRTQGKWLNLRSRANIVPGLDSRGAGGWIAFGEGYQLQRDVPPAGLPKTICEELDRKQSTQAQRGGSRRAVSVKPVVPVDSREVVRRLKLALVFGKPSLRARWAGSANGLVDTSKSGFDMSMSKLLANAGFEHDQIHWLLATQFRYGVVARDGLTQVTDRQLKRAAAKATQNHGGISRRLLEVFNGR